MEDIIDVNAITLAGAARADQFLVHALESCRKHGVSPSNHQDIIPALIKAQSDYLNAAAILGGLDNLADVINDGFESLATNQVDNLRMVDEMSNAIGEIAATLEAGLIEDQMGEGDPYRLTTQAEIDAAQEILDQEIYQRQRANEEAFERQAFEA